MTVRTRAELLADADTYINDNTTGDVTPAKVRQRIKDLADSALFTSDLTDATGKTTPVDADTMPINDSAASNVLKKVTWANIKATLKTYFDTLYQPAAAKLTTLAGQTWAADRFTYYTSSSAAAIGTITAAGRAILDDADAAAQRTTLGIGSMATRAVTISTSDPSGGADGDVWLEYTA